MMRISAIAIVALAASGVALAQTQPVVRVDVTPESVSVGEAAELKVTVLVPTWFTRPPVYPTFELANAMTRLPADSSYPIRERVGNESWSGIVRTYQVYPLLGASYRMTGQSMGITFANPGSDPISVDAEVPEIVLRGVVPEGAESLDPYVAGRSLVLSLDVDGELESLEVGDAVVLTYRAELDGLPAIFLPPLAPGIEFEGVSTYRDLPDVQDGETALRTEKVTLVFDAGGEFSIPGLELPFWNTASRSIEMATAAGMVVSVQGPPPPSTVEGDSAEPRWLRIAGIVVGTVALMVVLWRGLPALARHYREAAERRRQTEDYAFRQLTNALESNDSPVAYRALLRWLERLEPGMDARTFAKGYGDEPLSAAFTALSAAVYHDAGTVADLRPIRRKLAAARRRYLAGDRPGSVRQLPPLNP
jgi:hypothetical protein